MDIFDLSRALRHLYSPKDARRIVTRWDGTDKSTGTIHAPLWPSELGPIPDQPTLDAAAVEFKRSDAIQRLRKEAVRRFEEGKRNDVLLARYAKKLRQAVTRLVVLTGNTGDAQLSAIEDALDALEATWNGETLIEAEIMATPDPDAYTDEAIAASPHWGA